MLFVFNKDKIISYTIATSIVILLFLFSVSIIPNSDTKLMQVSVDTVNEIENKKLINDNELNNIKYNNIAK